MSNGYGPRKTTLPRDYAAYDQLPQRLRDASKYAVAKWCSHTLHQEYLDMVGMMEMQPAYACRQIINSMAMREPEDTYRAYGPAHPEADNHGRKLKPAKFAAWGKRK